MMPFFQNSKAKIVPKQTTFSYSKKTPEKIVEEREMKKTNELFNQINKDRKTVNNNLKNNNFFKNKFK